MNKDEIFLIVFLYGLVILIGSARSVLLPVFQNKRTSPIIAAGSFILVKSLKKSHDQLGSQKKTRDVGPSVFHDPVSIAQKAATTSRSSRG